MKRFENLAPPPRSVPLDVSLKALLGGFLQQFGWIFFTFGMFFVVIFVSQGRLVEGLSKQMSFTGNSQKATAVIISARETSAEENEEDVVLFGYQYEVDGQSFQGESYLTGWRYDEGDTASLEFLPDNPSFSRLEGGRWSVFSPWVGLIVLLFPAVGLVLVVFGFKTGLRSAKLLRHGRLAYGEFISKEATNTTVNDDPVYELSFKFRAESTGRDHVARARNHDTSRLEDEDLEPLLYLPSFPEEAVLVDNLPGAPQVDARGRLQGKNPLSVLAYLFLPVCGILLTLFALWDCFQQLA